MKKVLVSMAALCAASLASAQAPAADAAPVLTNKQGVPILPVKGDWAVGINAQPFLDYAVNIVHIMSNSTGNVPTLRFKDDVTINGKYFVSDQTAVRARISLNYYANTEVSLEDKTGQTPPADDDGSWVADKVENTVRSDYLNVVVGGGIERRFGTTRFQYYGGADAYVGLGSNGNNLSYSYGNALSKDYTNGGSWRPLTSVQGIRLTLGVSAFGGAEYFFLPKMSIGAEVGWGISYQHMGQGISVSEKWNVDKEKLVEREEPTANGSGSAFYMQNISGRLNFTIYF